MAEQKQFPEFRTGYEEKQVTIKTVSFNSNMNEAQAFEFVSFLSDIASEAASVFYDRFNESQKALENNEEDNEGNTEWRCQYYKNKWFKTIDYKELFQDWLEYHKEWSKDYEKPEDETDD